MLTEEPGEGREQEDAEHRPDKADARQLPEAKRYRRLEDEDADLGHVDEAGAGEMQAHINFAATAVRPEPTTAARNWSA